MQITSIIKTEIQTIYTFFGNNFRTQICSRRNLCPKFMKLRGIINNTLQYGCGNWSPTAVNNIKWSICEQGAEETFST